MSLTEKGLEVHTRQTGAGRRDNAEIAIAGANPRQIKALFRLLIKELRVNDRKSSRPTASSVCALPSSVELAGLEPATSWVQGRVRTGNPG